MIEISFKASRGSYIAARRPWNSARPEKVPGKGLAIEINLPDEAFTSGQAEAIIASVLAQVRANFNPDWSFKGSTMRGRVKWVPNGEPFHS